ncbi:hypothetical protein LSAT2_020518 [Lamellibrachia satsuma]|nr:hypothetical protein LSAT2_020518 [Lamellibrachia satsuma]
MLLLLSHGQASIERGFYVNQQMEVDNLCENTFIAQRVVHDHIVSVGGIFSVDITKDLMLSCHASRTRYQAYLDDTKRPCESGSLKRKRVDESDDLNGKKLHLEADIAELDRCADEFSTDAQKNGVPGYKTITSTQYRSSGYAFLDGANIVVHNATYIWHGVSGFNQSVCAVITSTTNDHIAGFKEQTQQPVHYTYHNVLANKNVTKCRFFKRAVSIEQPGLQFPM